MNSQKAKGLIIKCDLNGIITEIVHNSILTEEPIIKEKPFLTIPDIGSLDKAANFLEEIKIESAAFNWELNLRTNNKIENFYFTGAKTADNEILIIASDSSRSLNKLYAELIKINSYQIDTIKSIIKSSAPKENNEQEFCDDDLYNQISRLNNELANMQRLLTKKNVEQERLNKQLNDIITIDYLSGLYNRRFFYEKIIEEISRAKRLNYEVIIVMIDINNFKQINDEFGHEQGDKIIIQFAEITKKLLRKNFDFAFRFGGDEFFYILANCSKEDAYEVMKRIDDEFRRLNPVTSLSYGIVKLGEDAEKDIEKFIRDADKKMYRHKASLKSKKNKTNS